MSIKKYIQDGIVKPELPSAHNMFHGTIIGVTDDKYKIILHDNLEDENDNYIEISRDMASHGVFKSDPKDGEPMHVILTQLEGMSQELHIVGSFNKAKKTESPVETPTTEPAPPQATVNRTFSEKGLLM